LVGAGAGAESIWQRLSAALDGYVAQWSTMYRETCEATNLRGEQSEEVLDLRMRCLGENLDEVRALTDGLVSGHLQNPAQALDAPRELTPIARCADVRLLRSAVPLPRDERTLRKVQGLQASLRDREALYDLGQLTESLAKTVALRSQVEATNYKPLLGQLLELQGRIETQLADESQSERTLREALAASVAGGDELTAAKAATGLTFLVGYFEGRLAEGILWARLADALLDRSGSAAG
jgi:serine/threonine-protein kinase